MRLKRRDPRVLWLIVLAVGVAIVWFGISRYRQSVRCRDSKAAFVARVEKITHDADSQLAVGKTREEVARFFAANGIPLHFNPMGDYQEAAGTLRVPALPECVSSGCLMGSAEIRVHVAVDEAGTVINRPFVFATGINCL